MKPMASQTAGKATIDEAWRTRRGEEAYRTYQI